jgi:transformation/transcription domain-associated protein
VRFSAYVMVCQFMSTMTCPEKIYLQVYTAMIKAWQPEGRQQIHEALDLILPLLPSKLHDPGAKVPMWIRWTKRSLIEDGHSLGNLVHILQFIVRHRTLFQPWHGELALLLVPR